ncbi:MAG: hypothetical protein NZ602_11750 [Thermoguttaceae bacterium]|nr:hypothetical protein [Thermoguttaceae bacterium]MDW8038009.1 hypothetical protein [Thermoguttaceae bacterium]
MDKKPSSVWWIWCWLALPWGSWFLVHVAMQYFLHLPPSPRVGLPHLMPVVLEQTGLPASDLPGTFAPVSPGESGIGPLIPPAAQAPLFRGG